MLIVDAYNVLHQTGVLSPDLAGIDVPGLVRLLGTSRYATRKTTLVCDGGGSGGSGVQMGHVNVLFSGYHSEADDLIETLIDRYSHGGGLSVVSSDKRLRRAAKRRGSESIASDRFLRHLEHDHNGRGTGSGDSETLPVFVHEIPLDPWSVNHWMRAFGVEPAGEPAAESPPASRTGAKPGDRDPDTRVGRSPVREASPPTKAAGEGHALPPAAASAVPEADVTQKSPDASPEPVRLDPLLRAALEEWRGRLSPDDLDMTKWVDDVQPIPARRKATDSRGGASR
ncbi:MAG: NYN domain-containing protein [Planctomycetota bacterium]